MILFLSIPRIAPVRPQHGPAVLKGICNELSEPAEIIDINWDFFLGWGRSHKQAVNTLDNYFVEFATKLDHDTQLIYDAWLDSWVKQIVDRKPKLICVSVFSWQSQRFCRDILPRLRKHTDAKLLIGGQGLVHCQNLSANWAPRADFGWEMLGAGFIDYFMKGESENTFKQFLLGDTSVCNNDAFNKFYDLDTAPEPDYTDYPVQHYNNGYKTGVLPIESSRGCVRACAFCEMSSEHGDYRGKSGRVLAEECIHYYDKYGVKDFYFHDDLMNGSLPDFRDFCNTLLKWYAYKGLPDRFFTFSGYWIIRKQSQWSESDWAIMARAGGNLFVVGIETGSDRLRKIMRKGFNNADLEFSIAQMHKNRLKFYFMLISGIPGETEADFQESLDMLTRWQKYVATGTIIGVNLGTTATIEEGSDLYRNPDRYKLRGLGNKPAHGINWICEDTPELTYHERVRRRVKIQEHTQSLGYPLWKGNDHLRIIKDQYILNQVEWDHEYRTRI